MISLICNISYGAQGHLNDLESGLAREQFHSTLSLVERQPNPRGRRQVKHVIFLIFGSIFRTILFECASRDAVLRLNLCGDGMMSTYFRSSDAIFL